MLSLLIFFLFLMLVMSLVGRMARSSRRRAYEAEQRRREEMARRGGEPEGGSPFSLFPFGNVLGEMMRGLETRSDRVDPETGEWVEVAPDAEPAPPEPAPEGGGEPRKKRKRRRRPQSMSSSSPFGGFLGGMGMPSDGSGEFEVEPLED